VLGQRRDGEEPVVTAEVEDRGRGRERVDIGRPVREVGVVPATRDVLGDQLVDGSAVIG
jgi:hypothetical protein